VRGYLVGVREHLVTLQQAGAGGAAVNVANSDAHDRLIRRLYEVAESSHHAEEGLDGLPRFAVLAAGGYARREMSIASDVDLLFLVEDAEAGPFAKRALETIQYALWDANVEVGAALRTIDECIALGQVDETARTTLLGVRFLAGDAGLFHALGQAVRERLVPDVGAFVAGQQLALARRRERFGASLYLLQPNLKEGAGGLRDYHTAYWVARAAEPLVRDARDFLHAGLLTEAEAEDARRARLPLAHAQSAAPAGGRPTSELRAAGAMARAGYPTTTSGSSRRHARLPPPRDRRLLIVIEQCLARVARCVAAVEAVEGVSGSPSARPICASGPCACCSPSRCGPPGAARTTRQLVRENLI
jgi:hypothetical protein